jgi:hypothetical protein
VRSAACCFSLIILTAVASAQSALPKFENYPASEAFHGKPAAPRLIRSEDRYYRTAIRRGAAEGPNFAGHLTIAMWGCGSGCISIALVDAKSGEIHHAPFDTLGWGLPLLRYDGNKAPNEEGFAPLTFRKDSNLLIVRGCPEDENCATYCYVWTGVKLKLLKKIAAVEIDRE